MIDATAHPNGWFVPHDLATPVAGAARGPLAGLTAVVKDAFDIAGSRTGGGSPEWLAEQVPASSHAGAVAALLEAGATIVGRTVCDEFFYSLSGENSRYGTPVNPRAPGRVPGGSSSGSAAAVSAGICDIGLGTDTGGSIRVPAAFCGVHGLRSTHGRVDRSGVMAMAPSFDTVGWFAAGPGLLRAIGNALLDDGGRVAADVGELIVASDAFAQADDGVARVCGAVLAAAAGLLPRARHEAIAPDGFDGWREAFRVVQAWEVWSTYGEFVERVRPALDAGVAQRMAAAARITGEEAGEAGRVVREAREHLRRLIAPGTVVALPSAPSIAPAIEGHGASADSFRSRCLRLTVVAGVGGLPQVSIPAGLVDGCPVGLSLIGWPGADETLLDLAVALGRHCGALAT